MVFSFICFFVGKFVANVLFTKFAVNKVMVVFALIGIALVLYTALAPNFSAVYAAVAISLMMGPGWATIYSETLKEADAKYKETAGAICVMAIVGAAVVPAIQGLVSDSIGSLQLSFLVNAVCFAVIALFFLAKIKREN